MTSPRVLLIGLDGAAPGFYESWSGQGLLPFHASVMQDGASGVLSSTLPPYTPTAWTSIVTGVNPGRHGVFGFTRWTEDGQELLVDSGVCRSKTLWDLLSERGLESIVLNVPITYPPRPLRGILVSGMGTPPDATTYAFPEDVHELMRQNVPGYVPDVAISEAGHISSRQSRATIRAISQATRARLALASLLLGQRSWDFAMLVFEAPDRLQHLFWKSMQPDHPASAERDLALDVYRELDAGLERIVEQVQSEGPTTVLFVSDHGFEGLDWLLFLNNFFIDSGLLKLSHRPSPTRIARLLPQSLRRLPTRLAKLLVGRKPMTSLASTMDFDRTIAFSGRVYEQGVHVRPTGTAESDEQRLQTVIDVLSRLTVPTTGEKAIDRVVRREEAFRGPFVSQAPNIFPVFGLPGVMIANSVVYRGVWESRRGLPWGTHHPDGLIAAIGPGIAPRRGLAAEAQDVMPTVLAAMGQPVPPDLDGAPISGIVEERVGREETKVERESEAEGAYTREQEEEIIERLRGLGYFE